MHGENPKLRAPTILMYVPCILNSLLSRPTNSKHPYINNISYMVNTPTCFGAPSPSSGSLILLLCWSYKIIKVTNSIKSV